MVGVRASADSRSSKLHVGRGSKEDRGAANRSSGCSGRSGYAVRSTSSSRARGSSSRRKCFVCSCAQTRFSKRTSSRWQFICRSCAQSLSFVSATLCIRCRTTRVRCCRFCTPIGWRARRVSASSRRQTLKTREARKLRSAAATSFIDVLFLMSRAFVLARTRTLTIIIEQCTHTLNHINKMHLFIEKAPSV